MSANTLRDLNYQLKQICVRNKDGSFTTQRDRERLLTQIVDQLRQLGYRHMRVQSLAQAVGGMNPFGQEVDGEF